jgi:molybdenum-dependent DNA-binding transcriptional regulator ModE
MAKVLTETGRRLLEHIERLDYDAYDAARALLEEDGETGDWSEVIQRIEQESAAENR